MCACVCACVNVSGGLDMGPGYGQILVWVNIIFKMDLQQSEPIRIKLNFALDMCIYNNCIQHGGKSEVCNNISILYGFP